MNNARKPLAAINVTPLVDVLLILLVVMMLAMPMFVKKMPVDLPQTTISGVPTVVHSLAVSIGVGDAVMLDGNAVTLEQVVSKVNPDVSLELSFDRAVTYERVAQVIAQLQDAKPKDIALMTR